MTHRPHRLSPDTGAALRSHPARQVALTRPLRWLALGWADLLRCPLPGLLHGLAMAGFGALLFALARDRFWLLAGAFSGFLLVAPLLATGLYAVSRELEAGRVDVFMTDFPYSRRLLDNADWAALISPPAPFSVMPYAYAVKPGDDAWLAAVDAFVERIQSDGRLEAAARRHGLSPIVRLR